MEHPTYDALWTLWKSTPMSVRGFVLLAIADTIIRIFCFWDNLRHAHGVDRLTWLLASAVPIIGPIAYFMIALPERDAENADGPSDGDSWKASLR